MGQERLRGAVTLYARRNKVYSVLILFCFESERECSGGGTLYADGHEDDPFVLQKYILLKIHDMSYD